MRHAVFGRKLSRSKNERKNLLRVLVRDLLKHGTIVTSLAKAKAVQPLIEKLITRAKNGREFDKRTLQSVIGDRKLSHMLMEESKTRFSGRTSGYTRIIKGAQQIGDATQTARLSFVDERIVAEVVKAPESKTKKVSKSKETKKV